MKHGLTVMTLRLKSNYHQTLQVLRDLRINYKGVVGHNFLPRDQTIVFII